MNTDLEDLPQVILSKRAAQVFKEACSVEGKCPEQSYMRIGAKPGGCSGWKYSLDYEELKNIKGLAFLQNDELNFTGYGVYGLGYDSWFQSNLFFDIEGLYDSPT